MPSQYIYTLRACRPEMLTEGPTPDEAAAAADHVAYLERLAETGVVLLAGRTQTSGPETFGIVILVAETDQDAESIMRNDPAILGGAMAGKIFPYRIAVTSSSVRDLV